MRFINQPEILWKTAIDFEIENNEVEKTINLYRSLLQRTKHVKVFISLGLFYLSKGMIEEMRQIFI